MFDKIRAHSDVVDHSVYSSATNGLCDGLTVTYFPSYDGNPIDDTLSVKQNDVMKFTLDATRNFRIKDVRMSLVG